MELEPIADSRNLHMPKWADFGVTLASVIPDAEDLEDRRESYFFPIGRMHQ